MILDIDNKYKISSTYENEWGKQCSDDGIDRYRDREGLKTQESSMRKTEESFKVML